jgi:hypothetical protein
MFVLDDPRSPEERNPAARPKAASAAKSKADPGAAPR